MVSEPNKEDTKEKQGENVSETPVLTVSKEEISDTETQNGTIYHKGYQDNDLRQQMVRYAYKLGGLDFVKTIECENGQWNLNAVGDNGNAYGLCQMNRLYHKDIPRDYYSNENGIQWQTQIEYCYKKRKGGTKFYGPSRKIKGQSCASYVSDRFIFI